MKRLLIKNGTIVTLESPNRVLAGHAILVEDGKIKTIGPEAALPKLKAQVIDARGKVVMPGLINAHMHFYSTFARGLPRVKQAANFTEILQHLWWRLDRRLTLNDCYYSTLVAGIEAIRHGTTTIFDHHSSPRAIRGSLGRIARAIGDLGLRACLCYEVSDRNGARAAREGIQENLRFLEACRKDGNDRIAALFGLHASFTLEESTLRRCVAGAAKYQAGFHIHCAEDACDQEITRKKFGRGVVQRLADLGILGERTICAHGVHLGDEEWDLLARTGTAVAHNPQSNLNNAVGIMDLRTALRKGVLVGLGTDAMTGDMLEELRSAIWAQRYFQRDPGAAFGEAVEMLIRNNIRICGRYFEKVGELKEGWWADMILIDYPPPTPLTAANFPGHLVYGLAQGRVDTTIVGGQVLMKNRRLVFLDEDKIAAKARGLSGALWRRFQ